MTTAHALLQRVLDDNRVRHDHGYPVEVGPHRCGGCDLRDDIIALLDPAEDDPQTRREAALAMREQHPVSHPRHAMWDALAAQVESDRGALLVAQTYLAAVDRPDIDGRAT